MAYPPTKPETALAPKWAGEFDSFQCWVNKAQSWIDKYAVCIDAKGRRCLIGADFMRARDEDAFPVRFFWELVPVATADFVNHHGNAEPDCSSILYERGLNR